MLNVLAPTLAVLAQLAPAAGVSIAVQVQAMEVVAQEPFVMTVSVVADAQGNLTELQLPDTGRLQVLGQTRSEGTSVNLTPQGASYRRTVNITMQVAAPGPGTYPVGRARVKLGKETAESEPFSIRAVAHRGQQHAQQPGGNNAQEDDAESVPAAPGPQSGGVRASPQMLRQGMFATLEVDRPEVILGEQVTLVVRIFSRADLNDIDSLKLPRLDGFWTEDLDSPRRITPTMAVVEGQRYQSYLIRRMALFPTRAGTFDLAPVEATVTTGGSFFSAGRRVQVQSLPLTLVVQPLPAEGQPPGFHSGNVGSFTLKATLDRTRTPVDQPVTLTLRLEGTGNLKQAAVPRLGETPDFRAYDPTPSENIEVKQERFMGFKQLEYLLQPRKPGTFTLPPVALHFYDPEARAYRTVNAPTLTITVTDRGASASNGNGAPVANVLGVQARPLRLRVDGGRGVPLLRGAPWLGAAVGVPAGAALVSLLAGSWSRRRRQRVAADRSIHARNASRALQDAVRDGAGPDGVSRALNVYLEARVAPGAQGLTRAALVAACTSRGVPADDAQRLSALLDRLDAARYAPAGTVTVGALAEEAVAVVRALDARLGGAA